MIVLLDANTADRRSDGGANGRATQRRRNTDFLAQKRSGERQYMFDAAFGADSTQARQRQFFLLKKYCTYCV